MRIKDKFNLCDWILPLIVLVLAAGCGVARLWEPTREKLLAEVLASAVQVVLEQQEGRRFRTAH